MNPRPAFAAQIERSQKFSYKLPQKTISGTVVRVFADQHLSCDLNTHLNRTSLLVKLDQPIHNHQLIIVETHAKKLADVITIPKEGSHITAKGGYLPCKTKYSDKVRKYPALKAFNIWNNKPAAHINDDLNPVFKMGLKIADNNILNKDVFAVVYQGANSNKSYLIDIVAAPNRQDACKLFENNPQHQEQIKFVKQKEGNYSKLQPDNHLFSIRLYRMDFNNPIIYWDDFGKYFSKLFENVMMNPV